MSSQFDIQCEYCGCDIPLWQNRSEGTHYVAPHDIVGAIRSGYPMAMLCKGSYAQREYNDLPPIVERKQGRLL